MQYKEFCQHFDITIEAYEKLEIYHTLLLKWQKAINLVGSSTLDEAWIRHFLDSVQLAQYISSNINVVADLGSGAGFPGLVLAIMRPDIQVHLIEADERKSQFLRTVSRETLTNTIVHNTRIETLEDSFIPDLITARALTNLKELCTYSIKWIKKNPKLELLFLKGEKAKIEIKNAQQSYNFKLKTYKSKTAKTASILHLRNIKPCV
ncbi:MAG: 16S rRNA (guanine(527)-N(7))-methyltransferase RsmG [Alphaproteobacteria bacterium]|nr:16S rRNA (guanine(527)-N(7))-methyltransferase RsmG [Alphaproteobacteria bacterium]